MKKIFKVAGSGLCLGADGVWARVEVAGRRVKADGHVVYTLSDGSVAEDIETYRDAEALRLGERAWAEAGLESSWETEDDGRVVWWEMAGGGPVRRSGMVDLEGPAWGDLRPVLPAGCWRSRAELLRHSEWVERRGDAEVVHRGVALKAALTADQREAVERLKEALADALAAGVGLVADYGSELRAFNYRGFKDFQMDFGDRDDGLWVEELESLGRQVMVTGEDTCVFDGGAE
jgi:hypothetical protein